MSQTPESTHPSQARPPSHPGASPTPSVQPTSADAGLSAEMEAEIDAAMKSASQEPTPTRAHAPPRKADLDAAHAAAGPKPAIRGPRLVQGGREHRKGLVVSVGPNDIFIEFGPKELGVLPRLQFTDADLPKVGDQVEAVVDRFEASESLFICSRPGVVQKAAWEMLEPGQVLEARVTGVNKGGLELEVANHRAFMPASQVDTRRIEDLSVFVGQKVRCQVVKVDRSGRGNITLSRREIIAEERKAEFEKLKDSLVEGETREGVVKKIMPFGAFVDIGGIDGLLHISDLSHDRVNRVEDVLKEGDKVTVKVLKLDWENKRHSLGLKQLQSDPFADAAKDVVEGALLTGRVTKLMEFGAFVELAPGVEGLVHISELAWSRVGKTSDVVQPNKVVKVKVLKLDPASRKISLSIKQATDRPADEGPAGRPGARRGGRPGREEDTRKPEEILKETPQLRRLREQAAAKHGKQLKSGLGSVGSIGLGDLKL